ncbi:MAG: protein translocase subunit SecD [Planctomycetaceae bacterium]
MFDVFHRVLTLALQDADAAATVAEAAKEGADAAGTAAGDAAQAAGASGLSVALGLLVVLLVLIGPFVIGAWLAKLLNVRELGTRMGVTLLALTIGLMPFVVQARRGEPMSEVVRLGIDLAGGTNMVFQVKPEEGKTIDDAVMDKMVGAVAKRINPSGTEEITVRQVGADRLEVIVPGQDPQTVNEIKRRIVKLGSLEFYIVANANEESAIVKRARALGTDEKQLLGADNEVEAIWLPAFEINGKPKLLGRTDAVRRPVQELRTVEGVTEKYDTEEYLLLVQPPDERVSGKYLTSATPRINPENGRQMVSFRFNQRGAFLFGRLTGEYQPKPGRARRGLAIVLDRKVYSAPDIESVITDNGQITGDFTVAEAKELSDVLNAGALEVPIDPKPLSEATVDPTLGEDVRNKGVNAIFIAGVVVVLFMLVYYRFSGVVAVICLLLNLILVLAVMIGIQATFTLPGLAGFVLTIGMAVDANVLIFERMREEVGRGSSLRMSIQNGFGKALSTIVDANVTTLITAVILFAIGTDQVKGFAVTLFIGIVMSMFTALFVGRLVFDLAEKKRWIKQLRMFSFVGNTNWDFVGKQKFCGLMSTTLIVAGLAAFFIRDNNYDIDFTGGTMVTFQLTEPAETEDVQQALTAQFPESFTVERLTLAGENTGAAGKHFRLRTTESDSGANTAGTDEPTESAEDRVRRRVNDAFNETPSMKLLKVSMTYGDISQITIAADDESAEALKLKRFNEGRAAEITLSTEVAVGTIRDILDEAFGEIKAGDKLKYPDLGELIAVEGTAGSGLEAGTHEVHKYSTAVVRTMSAIPQEDFAAALSGMQQKLATSPLFDEVNTFASSVADEMKVDALTAIVVSLIAIVGYIWFRFQRITFGLAAVAALVHDVLIVVGMVAVGSFLSGNPVGDLLQLQDFRINLPMIAAFLTIVGYSLNDTIVVFDRIREVRGKNPGMTPEIVNTSLNQTLSRTLLTSLTTFLVVIILYVIGGEGIHGFAYCLTIGILVGTYSSIYVASPILIWLMNRDGGAAGRVRA